MPKREGRKDAIIKQVAVEVADYIRDLPDGAEATIGRILHILLTEKGYESKHLGMSYGYSYTKDDGQTYIIKGFDQVDIQYKVMDLLEGEIELDFSKWENMIVGLPYNLSFVVRKKKTQE